MRILTWNARHGGGTRARAIAERVVELAPDIAVISEFRNNASGSRIQATLVDAGIAHFATTDAPPRRNSVLLAARDAFERVPIPGLGMESDSGIWGRWADLDVLGFYFPLNHEKRPVFEAICGLDSRLLSGRSLLIGDFNTGRHHLDDEGSTFIASEFFDRLEGLGWIDAWRSRHPERSEFSWYSTAGNGFRIDHALASPALDAMIREIRYSHREREEGLSDHSVLWLDVDLDADRTAGLPDS